jgi:hypothetical protein
MMGFAVLQHVVGEPDEETGVQPLFTRQWPSYACTYYASRKTFVANTTSGPVDICNDGKFTLIADCENPHMQGALLPLIEEAIDFRMTTRARSSYVQKYGNPKWLGIMPEGVAPYTPEGDAFMRSLAQSRNPDAVSLYPHGSEVRIEGLQGPQSSVFTETVEADVQMIASILLGSDGTITKSAGVYSSPTFDGIRRTLVSRDLLCAVRAVNLGHVQTWLKFNYEETRKAEKASGDWVEPSFQIPLPDRDAQERVTGYAERLKSLHDIIQKEKASGCEVTQERVIQLATSLDVETPTLSSEKVSRIGLAPTDMARVVRVREARAAGGLDALGDERDDKLISELEEDEKKVLQGNSGKSETP